MKDSLIIKCPLCRKESEWTDNPSRPFCSERCRLIDLGRWVSGEYSLPGEDAPHSEDPYETD